MPSHVRNVSIRSEKDQFEIRSLEQVEKEHIAKTLHATQWNRTKTAKLLGIDRKTLYEKIKRYNIE